MSQYRLAKMNSDEARMAEVETAYNSILMINMRARLSGSVKGDKGVEYADKLYAPPPWPAACCSTPLSGSLLQPWEAREGR
jgi:hypothetical protein